MNVVRDPLPRADAADRIWALVEPAGDDGVLPGAEIRERAHLTRGQFENGKVQVREHKAGEEGKPFIFDGDGYAVTRNPGRCARAAAHRLRSIDRQLRRLHASVIAPLEPATVNSDPVLRYFDRQIMAMIEAMSLARQGGFSSTSKRIRENADTG